MASKKRTGADTCCYKCARHNTCIAFGSKLRNPCCAVEGSAECLVRREQGWCLVCPNFKGAKPNDPDQTKLFQEPAS